MRKGGWRATWAFAALVFASCGGGSASNPTPASTPTPLPPDGIAPVVLDSSNFDALVLGSGARPCLVEFQLPT